MDQKGEIPWFCVWNLGRVHYMEEHGFSDSTRLDPDDPNYDPDMQARFWLTWQLSEGPTINMRCGCQTIFDAQLHPVRLWGPAKQSYPVWIDRFKKEFDPKGLSGCGWPYILDKLVEEEPEIITEEARATLQEMASRPWQGNP